MKCALGIEKLRVRDVGVVVVVEMVFAAGGAQKPAVAGWEFGMRVLTQELVPK